MDDCPVKGAQSKVQLFQSSLNSFYLVSITDKKGAIIYANDLFVSTSGFSVEELVGKNHRIINSGVHSKDFFADMWKTILSGKSWRGEVCNRKKNGDLYWVDSIIFPLMDSEEELYFMSLRADITIRKNLERGYKELLELKSDELLESRQYITELFKSEQINQFSATLCHEIKRPLSSILMQIDCVMIEHKDLNNVIKEKLGRLQLSSKKTLDLANYINRIFRRSDNKEKAIPLIDFINKIIEFANVIFYYDSITFDFERDREYEVVSSEEVLFISIFNLIKNAAEAFNKDQGIKLIKIKLFATDDIIQIIISDNAGGIPNEVVQNLFTRKVQSTKIEGTGMGLSITKTILLGIGATIMLVDNKQGGGATFKITIPKRGI